MASWCAPRHMWFNSYYDDKMPVETCFFLGAVKHMDINGYLGEAKMLCELQKSLLSKKPKVTWIEPIRPVHDPLLKEILRHLVCTE